MCAVSLAHGALVPADHNDGLILPPGFRAIVVADKLKPLRNMTVAPNGDIYIKTRRRASTPCATRMATATPT
ncbi:MAG: hypothetical protein WDM96_10080 [Lacunisphaera sp.]